VPDSHDFFHEQIRGLSATCTARGREIIQCLGIGATLETIATLCYISLGDSD